MAPMIAAPLVSVITPVYNVADYLPQCLDSLKSQTLHDIEFICINDGSTDESLSILQSYAHGDERFVVIDKENSGYGASMNVGLSVARGKYIGIVESDDYAESYMFERLSSWADQYDADICKSRYIQFDTAGGSERVRGIPSKLNDRPFTNGDKTWVALYSGAPSIWSSIYRRAFLLDNDIKFLETPGASFQDTGFVFKAWFAMKRGYTTSDAYLHYRQGREGSSVLSTDKSLCVCDEYAGIRSWLEARPGNHDRDLQRLNARKAETYRWNSRRLARDSLGLFVKHAHEEFQSDELSGLIKRELTAKKDWEFVRGLIEMPEITEEKVLAENWKAKREASPAERQNKALVSVIIPIFNVQDYLEECLDSILAQTHKNLEVICVNDGSTDSSLQIMRRYEEKDSRVKVIDKPNGGYGHSVNRGLEAATGDWISIIEPDDFIDKNMYADLLSQTKAHDGHLADFVKSGYWLYFDLKDGTEPYIETPNIVNCMPKTRQDFTVYENWEVLRHHPCIWSAIYRKEFLDHFSIKMIEPPGAGWADNPWFFDTMLRAQSIVWIPASYYYYRQTNPNASSKLKDYHMPFDRLRDIRGIFEHLGIDDPNILGVLYQRNFNYIITSVLEEFGFDESDPELLALIREVFESMDEDLLMATKKGIPKRFKDYYRDVMGRFLAEVKSVPASDVPAISILLPMKNDRDGLWDTLNSIMAQDYKSFEVVCVDCESKDRSGEIIASIAKKDQRFSLLDYEAQQIGEGYDICIDNARGEWLLFMRSGTTLLREDSLSRIMRGIVDANEEGAEYALLSNTFNSPGIWNNEGPSAQVAKVAGNEARLINATAIAITSRFMKTSFVKSHNLRFSYEGDSDGYAFGIRGLLECESVLLIEGITVQYGMHFDIERKRFESEDDFIAYEEGRLSAIAEVYDELKTKAARHATQAALLKCLDFALSFVGRYKTGRGFFEFLRDVYHKRWGLANCSKVVIGNYAMLARLEQSFTTTYEVFLQRKLGAAVRERDAAQRKNARITQSGSYKLVRKMSAAAKKVIPMKLFPNLP